MALLQLKGGTITYVIVSPYKTGPLHAVDAQASHAFIYVSVHMR